MTVVDIDAIKVVDTDTHVIEPYDLWTSRVPAKFGDLVPHVRWDPVKKADAWYFGDEYVRIAASAAMARSPRWAPERPATLAETDPVNWDAKARLAWMDEHGIHAQVLYPNVAGFGTGRFLTVKDPELTLACVRAYNDFLVEFSESGPGRYIPVMAVPFWDLDASLAEIHRAAELGHRGIVFGSQPEDWGEPPITSRHWDPIWALAQEMELPVNFHIASGDFVEPNDRQASPEIGLHAEFSSNSVVYFLGNARAISKIIHGGVCHRFPRLNFVSVESGVGWIPFAIAAMDWQWKNAAVALEHPEYDLLPSEYFRRQWFGCFWFEEASALAAIDILGPDNILFETDFPHPTSMTPGPASAAISPRDHIRSVFHDVPLDVTEKILHGNAARLYKLSS